MISDSQPTPRPNTPDLTVEEARASARAIVNLFDRWNLANEESRQVLGGFTQRTWARWKQGKIGRIDLDLGTRLSLFLGVHKGTRYMFSRDLPRAYRWIKAKNAAFGGQSALDVMLGGRMIDLYHVRLYLDAERNCPEPSDWVYTEPEPVRSEVEDPALVLFLDFIEADIKAHPERLRMSAVASHDYLKALVGDVVINLDEPMSVDDE